MSLGDMGAEVIKIEEPGKGDDTRGWPPFAGGEATYFLSVNRNKKSLTLNMKPAEGQEILRALIEEGRRRAGELPPRHDGAARLRLRHAAAGQSPPRLLLDLGLRRERPRVDRPGLRPHRPGRVGRHGPHGLPRRPARQGGQLDRAISSSGMAAAQGIALALLARERTGKGQKVEIGMLDVMASLLTYQAGSLLEWRRAARRGAATSIPPSFRTRSSRRRMRTSRWASRTTRSGGAPAAPSAGRISSTTRASTPRRTG